MIFFVFICQCVSLYKLISSNSVKESNGLGLIKINLLFLQVLDASIYKKILSKIFLLKDMWRSREPKVRFVTLSLVPWGWF